MKNRIKNFVVFALAGSLIFACAGNPEVKKEEKKLEKLSLDTKAKNTFKNTTVIFTGAMVLAFSDVFKGQAEAFAEAFQSELNEEDLKALDDEINGLGDEIIKPLEEMITNMDQAFDEMAKENITIYEKMFLHDVMKEGVAITEKYTLPVGFRPLSQDLTKEEIKRYIIKVSTDGQNPDDPIIKTYTELFEWFQKVGDEFNADPEIKAFMQSMQE